MFLGRLFGFLALTTGLVSATNLTGYEYIVVGSGAGGGPLAARLALAGHKTLLIEAGDDQGHNVNYTVPAFSAKASEDEKIAWNFFVRHYADDERQARDFKTTYETPDGDEYIGLNPPEGSKMKGVLYPRTGTLGGCTAHNALIAIYPDRSDLENIASLTGDDSWSPNNMRKYFVKMENNGYLPPGRKGHGYDGWLGIEHAPLSIMENDTQLHKIYTGGAYAFGNDTETSNPIQSLLHGDANADTKSRDTTPAYYQIPISTHNGRRNGPRDFLVRVRDATNDDGSKKYPLDIRMNSQVTKVVFDESADPPRATGVEFLDGKYLYKASPARKSAQAGKPGRASASREVIVSGGVYNSPQILKLSGVGPAAELQKFGIKVLADRPGVGTNLQDHYESTVQVHVPNNFSAFGGPNPDIHEGFYTSSGLLATFFYKSSTATENDYDVFVFGGPINFRGFFPGYSINITAQHNLFSWAMLKAHPRNRAGSVTLRSADPLDMPDILFNYLDTGSGNYSADLQALYETIGLARDAFHRAPIETSEIIPGKDITSKKDIETYIADTAWGHHASCTCPIGRDDDPHAVLDSNFNVRGVKGLRVVDASVFPKVPGTFTAVPTYLVAEKAADVILGGLGS